MKFCTNTTIHGQKWFLVWPISPVTVCLFVIWKRWWEVPYSYCFIPRAWG